MGSLQPKDEDMTFDDIKHRILYDQKFENIESDVEKLESGIEF